MRNTRWSSRPLIRDNQPTRNPLTKWSLQLKELYQGRRNSHLRYPFVGLGLQGCRSGFNATNTLRTSLFFQTCPPTFLGLKDWSDIQNLDRGENTSPENQEHLIERTDSPNKANGAQDALGPGDRGIPLAWFADSVRFATPEKDRGGETASSSRTVTVALENFHRKAVSIHRFRFPKQNHFPSPLRNNNEVPQCDGRETQIAVIAGHENNGVDQETLEKADHVVFIPQYGTISSLNVVTSIGIALYYLHLDQRGSRVSHCNAVAGSSAFAEFLQAFAKDLPLQVAQPKSTETGSVEPCAVEQVDESPSQRQRIDPRPIHPSFYQLEHNDIMKHHDSTVRDFIRQQKLVVEPAHDGNNRAPVESRSEGGDAEPAAVKIRLSLVYENEFDQRNLGGLFRLANAFLADVHYIGRRRLNRQGAVGSYLYTEKTHYATVDDFLNRNGLDLANSSAHGILPIMAFLSCEQEFLFHTKKNEATAMAYNDLQQKKGAGTRHLAVDEEDDGSASLAEDISAYEQQWGIEIGSTLGGEAGKQFFSKPMDKDLFLDQNDSVVTDRIRQLIVSDRRFCQRSTREVRLFILVPQEGHCPAARLTQHCAQRIRLLSPEPHPCLGSIPAHRGLPAQVATGITLERLFSLLLFRG
jgi:hypothetical protein